MNLGKGSSGDRITPAGTVDEDRKGQLCDAYSTMTAEIDRLGIRIDELFLGCGKTISVVLSDEYGGAIKVTRLPESNTIDIVRTEGGSVLRLNVKSESVVASFVPGGNSDDREDLAVDRRRGNATADSLRWCSELVESVCDLIGWGDDGQAGSEALVALPDLKPTIASELGRASMPRRAA